ncbi:MAG: phosphohydrolase [Lachnobacterium sp.]|nr:phosphohydrolase [Lachnobacterium sp.]
MLFVRSENLTPNMRLAKPIYNKTGVLLYERDSKITSTIISSISNFGLIGVYILEPAEPVPPLSAEDIEFEKNQTVFVFSYKESIDSLKNGKLSDKFNPLVEQIIKIYGSLNHPINFVQNMRSPDDYVYKHGVSVAILCALISKYLKLDYRYQKTLISAAFLSNFGNLFIPDNIARKGTWLSANDKELIQISMEKGLDYLKQQDKKLLFPIDAIDLVEYYILSTSNDKIKPKPSKMNEYLSNILKVANAFDQLTAMNINHTPLSDVTAMKFLYAEQNKYSKKIVDALSKVIHIMPKGACIDLTTGDAAIVLEENNENFMKPVILRLIDNKIYDLNDPRTYKYIQIYDSMKTMDNRIKFDDDTLKQFQSDPYLNSMLSKFKRSS